MYLRTKLQAQLIAGHKGSKDVSAAAQKMEEAQRRRRKLQKSLKEARDALEEVEQKYHQGGTELASSFKTLSDQVRQLVNGPVGAAFGDLSNQGGEGSSDEGEADGQPEPVSPERIERFRSLVLKLEAALSLSKPLSVMEQRIEDRLQHVEADTQSI